MLLSIMLFMAREKKCISLPSCKLHKKLVAVMYMEQISHSSYSVYAFSNLSPSISSCCVYEQISHSSYRVYAFSNLSPAISIC